MRVFRFLLLIGSSFGLMIALLVFIWPAPLPTHAAATFTVNSPADVVDNNPGNGFCDTGGGVCTLRAAIMEANHTPGGGAAIHFGLPGEVTYLLSIPKSGSDGEATGDLNITRTMSLLGNGAGITIIDGNGAALNDKVFRITETVFISGVTIQHGSSPNYGGGILNFGTLTLNNSAVISNTTANSINAFGGGIYSSGQLTLTNSIVRGNSTGTSNAYGGGIFSQGVLRIDNSTISGNTTSGTSGLGGGILSFGPTPIIRNSIIRGNRARIGGGIYNGSNPLVIINSTISSNYSDESGGGIYNNNGTTSLFNVTIHDNVANYDAIAGGSGGGVANGSGTINFQNSIIAVNYKVVVINDFEILDPGDCLGTITSGGNNILYNTSSCTVNGAATIADPMLNPLAYNSGPTLNHTPLPGSPAIDAGNPGGCTNNLGAILTSDQRGVTRPVNGGSAVRCDIGAIEFYPDFNFLPLIAR